MLCFVSDKFQFYPLMTMMMVESGETESKIVRTAMEVKTDYTKA